MTNFALEVANNLRTINQQGTWFFLTWFIVWGFWISVSPQDITIKDVRRLVLSLAFAMWLHDSGGLIIGYTVWFFRAMGIGGGSGRPDPNSIYGMVAGQLTIAIAHVGIIGILSINRFGNLLWLLMLVADVAYLACVLS